MIVLKKIDAQLVEKIIQPGQTEEFFDLSLEASDAFDWNVKILYNDLKGITKITSLYNDGEMENSAYAVLGRRFRASTSIFVFSGDRCKFEITNNELSAMKCSVKLKTF